MKRNYELVEANRRTGLCVTLADNATSEQVFAALQGVKWRRFRPGFEVEGVLDRLGFILLDTMGEVVGELALVGQEDVAWTFELQ